jgi:hypothetical protein
VCICSLGYSACNTHAPYCLLWPTRLGNIFSHYLINGTIFEKKNTEHKMCVLIFSTRYSVTFLILRITKRDMIKMFVGLHLKYLLFFSDFNETWIFSTDFRKHSNIKKIFMKIRRVGPSFFHACGRTDRQKWRSVQSLFAPLRTRLKINLLVSRPWKNMTRDQCFSQCFKITVRNFF